MSYTPKDLLQAQLDVPTPFFLAYNSNTLSNIGYYSNTVTIDTCAQQETVTVTNNAIENAPGDTLVARADVNLTPYSANFEWCTHLNLHSPANPDAVSQSPNATGTTPMNAYQDHPARTSYGCFFADEVLMISGTDSLGLLLTRASTGTAVPNCYLPAQRGVIVGCFL